MTKTFNACVFTFYSILCDFVSSSILQIKMSSSEAARELTEEQSQVVSETFGLFDQHGVQTIATDELGSLMRALGQIPTQQKVHEIIEEIDADGNGVMEYYEFVDLMSRLPWGEQGSEEELTDAVHGSFGVNDDGRIDVAEFRHVMTSLGEKLTDEEVDMLLKQLEPDGEGLVDCQEIIDTILRKPKRQPC